MSDSNDRSPSSSDAPASESAGESLFQRIKLALGLKSQPSLREDLAEAIHSDVSDFSSEERALLQNILGLREKRVDDVMVPRADIIAVPIDVTLAELLSVFQTAGHSRLPVYAHTLDEPLGMVHIRDFVGWLADQKASGAKLADVDLSASLQSIGTLVRDVLFVPPSMLAFDLLAKMQKTQIQLALVIDEYGGTDGLVSMEDIVEIVLGDIEDEHDEADSAMIVSAGEGSFVVDARADLQEVVETIGLPLNDGSDRMDADTLGGWLVALAGRVPTRGEIVCGPGKFGFEILDANARRIKQVRAFLMANPDEEKHPSGTEPKGETVGGTEP